MQISTAFVLALAGITFASPVANRDAPRVVSVPLQQLIAAEATSAHIVRADSARLESYKAAAQLGKRQSNVPVANAIVSYLATVDVGANSQSFSLIVDTGSSNTWVGANTKYVTSSSSTSTGDEVSVSYGSGSFSGSEYLDTVTIGGVSVTKQSIGVASTSTGFTDVDGIFGVGPVDLTANTVTGASEVPTFMENAVSQNKIPANILGVSFKPATTSGTTNGVLTLGGVDSSLYTGQIGYGSLTTTSPASSYWGIDVTFSAGGETLGSNSGIVDTGTTLVYLASDVVTKYFSGSGYTSDSSSGLYRAQSASGAKDLVITFGGKTYTWAAANTLVPAALYSDLGLTTGYSYSWVGDYGQDSGSGLDFILGQKFLEHFYSVFDTDSSRLGFATTSN